MLTGPEEPRAILFLQDWTASDAERSFQALIGWNSSVTLQALTAAI